MLACLEAKLPPNLISWCLFLQIFLGGMAPDPLERACAHQQHQQLSTPNLKYLPPPMVLCYTPDVQLATV